MIHLVSYDLNGKEPSSSYDAIKRVITTNAIDYRHVLKSGWLVYTSSSPEAWYHALANVVDQDDRFIVSQLHNTDWAFLTPDVIRWTSGKL